MHRETLPVDRLGLWAHIYNVTFNGVKIAKTADTGCGIIATSDLTEQEQDRVLITVPKEVVLSLENVWIQAKADQHLRQVLTALGEYGRLTHGISDGKIGISNAFSEYVKYLPAQFPIPTFWDETDLSLLVGTSLHEALTSKVKTLNQEFSQLQASTISIDWCQMYWWDSKCGRLTFDDWKQVDAIYRSRALDLPGTGHATVPIIDMANHASGEKTTALYETDSDGNAILLLREGTRLTLGQEVTITYGDEKGACEMLFSYGFIESSVASAKEIFLSLDIPDDDPLKLAKKAFFRSAPGFRVFEKGVDIIWEGCFVWLICVNEEDGLQFRLLQDHDGRKTLQASWNDQEIEGDTDFKVLLEETPLWDVFQLRAITTLQSRVEEQLLQLEKSKSKVAEVLESGVYNKSTTDSVILLRNLEESLLLHAYSSFDTSKTQLLESAVVQDYLANVE